METTTKCVCKSCGGEFSTPTYRLKQGRGKYCSRDCRTLAQRSADGCEVDGLWFGRSGRNAYYWHKNGNGTCMSLHKYVWEKHNGPVPDGFEVHHIDGNTANNSIDNITVLTRVEHGREHIRRRVEAGTLDLQKNMHAAQLAARAWHSTPEGLAWHSEHGKRAWEGRERLTDACILCGKQYNVLRGAKKRGFCSPSCQGMARKASGVDDEGRACSACGAVFRTNKYGKTKTCSKDCWKAQIAATRRSLYPAGSK